MGRVARRARLGAEIVAAYAQARWQLWRRDLPATLAELRACAPAEHMEGDQARAAAFRLARAARRVLELIPADTRCLMRSLVMTRLLARRGVDTTLVLAVRTADEFGAHAWVEVEGQPVLEPASTPFERLAEL
ncbi:MAG: lasso peptide biosynthesis B2 protein [Thermoleophilaceae bacterium]